jgi:hypothetical protein
MDTAKPAAIADTSDDHEIKAYSIANATMRLPAGIGDW